MRYAGERRGITVLCSLLPVASGLKPQASAKRGKSERLRIEMQFKPQGGPDNLLSGCRRHKRNHQRPVNQIVRSQSPDDGLLFASQHRQQVVGATLRGKSERLRIEMQFIGSPERSTELPREAPSAPPSSLKPQASRLRPPGRRGLSLLEVLISMGILAVGLLGVAAMLPAGRFEMQKATNYDFAGMVGRSAFRDLKVRGYLNPIAPRIRTIRPPVGSTAEMSFGRPRPNAATTSIQYRREHAIVRRRHRPARSGSN